MLLRRSSMCSVTRLSSPRARATSAARPKFSAARSRCPFCASSSAFSESTCTRVRMSDDISGPVLHRKASKGNAQVTPARRRKPTALLLSSNLRCCCQNTHARNGNRGAVLRAPCKWWRPRRDGVSLQPGGRRQPLDARCAFSQGGTSGTRSGHELAAAVATAARRGACTCSA